MLKKIAVIICTLTLAAILLSSCLPAPHTPLTGFKPGDYNESLDSGNRTRTYTVHIPLTYNTDQAMPLVVVLHGSGGSADTVAETTDMSDKADAAGFIVVYPNGTGLLNDTLYLTWNCGFCCGYASDNNIDDVGFMRSLIGKLEGELNIDKARIFITGFSNGAMLAYRLGCELSDIVAAIAPVSGSMGDWETASSSPVSVIIFHGTADAIVPYEGGTSDELATEGRIDKPVSYAVNFWVTHNGCSTAYTRDVNGDIVRDSYSGGRGGSEVVLYTIVDGQHAWPGDNPAYRVISATDLIWEFFAAHPKL